MYSFHTRAYHSLRKAQASLAFLWLLFMRALYSGHSCYPMFIALQSLSFIFQSGIRTLFKTVISEMLGADNWTNCWCPFVSSSLHEAHPSSSPSLSYWWLVFKIRNLVKGYVILHTSPVRTTVHNASFRHFFKRNTSITQEELPYTIQAD